MSAGTRKLTAVLAVLALCVVAGLLIYNTTLRKVRLAFVGFPDTQWANFEEVGLDTPYSLHKLDREDLGDLRLEKYHATLIWGMGFNPDPYQKANLERSMRKGANLVMVMATSKDVLDMANTGQERQDMVAEYLKHGGHDNLHAMMDYLAHELAGRRAKPAPVVEKPESGFFHLGDAMFASLEEYEAYLDEIRPNLRADAPKLALVGAFVNPGNRFERVHADRLIQEFEKRGVRVYPVFGFRESPELLKEANPDLALVMPHGRLAENNQVPEMLAEMNIPCIGALSLLADRETWLGDPQGLAGGFLSQSITMPELDGVIEPVVIASRDMNERGLQVPTVIEDRLERLTARTMNWLELRHKPNAEKKVVIVYYKSPGMAAVAAAGLETAPSLWNLLKHLQDEGYDLGGQLPADADALYDLIQTRGKTLGQWAIGAFETFLEEADPELIPAQTYARWFQDALSPARQKETLDLWGAIPGDRMVTTVDEEPYLVVSRIQLGNVVIMPQPTVGTGDDDEDEIATIHGTDQAAPHFYLGAYLWARNGFGADAIVHFGTHGSLEFTYGKSACMSRDCWPDILIGDVPHIYPYIINNVGEALVAKRRSYGVTVSHLTPPFTESGIYGDLVMLQEKLHTFNTETDPMLKLETRRTLSRLVHEYDMARDLNLPPEAGTDRLLTDDELSRLTNLIHELEAATITDGLHVLGRPFTEEQILSTVTLMLGEPGYKRLRAVTGRPDDPAVQDGARDLARSLVTGVLAGDIQAEQFFSADELAVLRDPHWGEDPNRAAQLAALKAEAKEAGLPHDVLCGCPGCIGWVASHEELAQRIIAASEEGTAEVAEADDHGDGHEHGHAAEQVTLESLKAEAKEAGLPHDVRCGCSRCAGWVATHKELATRITEATNHKAAAAHGQGHGQQQVAEHVSLESLKAEAKASGLPHDVLCGCSDCIDWVATHRDQAARIIAATNRKAAEDLGQVHEQQQVAEHVSLESLKAEAKAAGLPHDVLCGCPRCVGWVAAHKELATRITEATNRKTVEVAAADDHSHGPSGHSHNGPSGKPVVKSSSKPSSKPSGKPIDVDHFWGSSAQDRPQIPEDRAVRLGFLQVLDDIQNYAQGLRESPRRELEGVTRALSGGYIQPSSGGDALFNPAAVPTGRNLYSINAEKTPTEEAWRVGKMLADQVLADHRARTGNWPRQAAFSLWGGEFIRSKGSTMAQVMYLMGVRPLRNSRGTVYDVELIPSEELGRPRIDVLVQTSGQFRDAGASRITLLDKAVQMVAALPDEEYPNYVRDGVAATEMALKENGMAPQRARELATARIFGSAANQSYGANIMRMVESGDTWEDSAEVAERYLQNMGGIYRDADNWGTYEEGVFAAAMQGTELVIQPRSSNTWGPLSLDHVYEFMGGLTASIRHTTGNDPTGYFSDRRARGQAKATNAVQAIREEARTKLWNPRYLEGLQGEGAAAAAGLTESVRNMYGWNVMQPSAIDETMWDETYEVMVEDKHGLNLQEFFEEVNPYALQDMSAVMLETARKGMWSPDPEVLQNLAELHADLVARYGAACSRETCNNAKLREFLNAQLTAPGSTVPDALIQDYAANLSAVLESSQPLPNIEGLELEERIETVEEEVLAASPLQNVMLAGAVVMMALVSLFWGARGQKQE